MDLQQKQREVYQQFRKASFLAEIYLQQKSKATWLRLGDDNTKYSHSVIKHRRMKQATTQIRDNKQGNWQIDPDKIARVFVDYYEDLQGKNTTTRVKAFNIF